MLGFEPPTFGTVGVAVLAAHQHTVPKVGGLNPGIKYKHKKPIIKRNITTQDKLFFPLLGDWLKACSIYCVPPMSILNNMISLLLSNHKSEHLLGLVFYFTFTTLQQPPCIWHKHVQNEKNLNK
jgi:hypothetical protein